MWFQGFQKHGSSREQGQSRSVYELNEVTFFNPVTPGYPQDLSARRVIDFAYPYAAAFLLVFCLKLSEKPPYNIFISLEHLRRILDFQRLSPYEHHCLESGFHSFIAVHLRSPS